MLGLFFLLLASARDAAPAGVWEGPNVCLVRPSPCNDEAARFRTEPIAGRPDAVHMILNKMVEGKEEYMADFDFEWNAKARTLTGTYARNGRTSVWKFTVEGDRMNGTCTVEGTPYRRMTLRRVSSR